ncbi:MAG: 2,3-bisphosphoglycerate-independent phosphoglycerate mutase [Saprospiraceae bacterium]
MSKRVLLAILDGWGLGLKPSADAIAQAKTPFVDGLFAKYPHSRLVTFGEQVGLPEGQMGNSEVGHMNIGAGRIVYQELTRIDVAVRGKALHTHPVLLEALENARKADKNVHFIGLVSDGGVHSHIQHLLALCDIAIAQGNEHVYVHAFTDGRDCDPKSGAGFLKQLENHLKNTNVKIASVIGRFYAMDRDKRWERVKKAYDVLVHGKGDTYATASEGLLALYEKGITDEFVTPFVVSGSEKCIEDGDTVISFNFRTDRPREITEVLSQVDFPEFEMKKLQLNYVTMTRYDDTYKNVKVIFEKDDLKNTLGEVISAKGQSQVRIAETEKYPHVTFFFSGGREDPFPGEQRILIPSVKDVPTYDLKPEMSAAGITDAIVGHMEEALPNFICLNYANTDMVGHTGVFTAAMIAAETVDACAERLVGKALSLGYECIIIADHGNSDYMINEDGSPNTAHTMNLVPCIYVSKYSTGKSMRDGKLGDVAPTILSLLHIDIPAEMTGINLIL